jgi:hypothetical protein
VPLRVGETIDISELTTRPNYVEVHTPKFSHGTGSKIVLALKVINFPNVHDFDAAAVYDQGSAGWVEAGALTYKGFVDTITRDDRALIALIVSVVIAIVVVILWRTGALKSMMTKSEARGNLVVVLAVIAILSSIVVAVLSGTGALIDRLNSVTRTELTGTPLWSVFFSMFTAAAVLVSVLLFFVISTTLDYAKARIH